MLYCVDITKHVIIFKIYYNLQLFSQTCFSGLWVGPVLGYPIFIIGLLWFGWVQPALYRCGLIFVCE